MNKEDFGLYICKLRKEKNLTQKELADKLIVSDKAVSKWERGISYPDITLLEPLSLILGVSITELIQGGRIDMKEKEKDVEETMQKTLDISYEQSSILEKNLLQLRIVTFILLTVISIFECVFLFILHIDMEKASMHLWTVESLALFFGLYFWIVAKDKIPIYYDENKISFYTDGVMKMNIPGVHFNNSNWPHILKVTRIWSAVVMVLYPILTLGLDKVPVDGLFLLPIIFIAVFSIFIPLVYVGKKYE